MGAVAVALLQAGLLSVTGPKNDSVSQGSAALFIVIAFADAFKEQWVLDWLSQGKPGQKVRERGAGKDSKSGEKE